MYLAVIDVKPLNDYKLLLTFENGEKRIFDVRPYLDKETNGACHLTYST